MVEAYVRLNRTLRALTQRAWDGILEWQYDDKSSGIVAIQEYIDRDIRDLEHAWPAPLAHASLHALKAAAAQPPQAAFGAVLKALAGVEDAIDAFFGGHAPGDIRAAILEVLHPVVISSAYQHFRTGDFRSAVLDAFVAVFDLIRSRSGLDLDGAGLVTQALSLDSPILVLSTLDTESGRSEQKGFIQVLQGAYLGVRNPKAHSLLSDLTEVSAAQYLVFASLLARRIAEAKVIRG